MSTNKLTPLEELRLEKKRLREERAVAGKRLSTQLEYLNNNWGVMLTKEVTSTFKSRFAESVCNLSEGATGSIVPFLTKGSNPLINLALSSLPSIGSLAWGVARPAIFAFIARKATSFLFGRRKRSRR